MNCDPPLTLQVNLTVSSGSSWAVVETGSWSRWRAQSTPGGRGCSRNEVAARNPHPWGHEIVLKPHTPHPGGRGTELYSIFLLAKAQRAVQCEEGEKCKTLSPLCGLYCRDLSAITQANQAICPKVVCKVSFELGTQLIGHC